MRDFLYNIGDSELLLFEKNGIKYCTNFIFFENNCTILSKSCTKIMIFGL